MGRLKPRANPKVDLLTKHLFLLRIMRDTTLSGSAKAVAAELVERFNDDPTCLHPGFAWPSLNTIAKATGLNRETVKDGIERLVCAKNRYFDRFSGDKTHSNLYRPRFAMAREGLPPREKTAPRGEMAPALGAKTGRPRGEMAPLYLSNKPSKIPPRESALRAPRSVGNSFASLGQKKRKNTSLAKTTDQALAVLNAFEPSPDIAAWASKFCPAAIDPCGPHHVENFRQHYLAAPNPPRGDLNALYRKWLLREQKYITERSATGKPNGKSDTAAKRLMAASLNQVQEARKQ